MLGSAAARSICRAVVLGRCATAAARRQCGTAAKDGHSERGQLASPAAFTNEHAGLLAAFGAALGVMWYGGYRHGSNKALEEWQNALEERYVLFNELQEERRKALEEKADLFHKALEQRRKAHEENVVLFNKALQERQKAHHEKVERFAQSASAGSQAELAKAQAELAKVQAELAASQIEVANLKANLP